MVLIISALLQVVASQGKNCVMPDLRFDPPGRFPGSEIRLAGRVVRIKIPGTLAFLVVRNYSQLNIISWQSVVHEASSLFKMI